MKIPWEFITTIAVAVIGSSWFANWVSSHSKFSNKRIMEAIDANAADVSRRRILTFDSEIRKGEKHTKEDFNDVVQDIDKYDAYCKAHPEYPNTRAEMAEQHVKTIYQKCLDQNDFL